MTPECPSWDQMSLDNTNQSFPHPCIPTQTYEENKCGNLKSQGWLVFLIETWCLIGDFIWSVHDTKWPSWAHVSIFCPTCMTSFNCCWLREPHCINNVLAVLNWTQDLLSAYIVYPRAPFLAFKFPKFWSVSVLFKFVRGDWTKCYSIYSFLICKTDLNHR